MAEAAPTVVEEQQELAPEIFPVITGEDFRDALTPAESPLIEEPPILTRNPTPEIQLAQMAGGENYDDLKHKSQAQDQDRLNRASRALFSLGGNPKTIANAIKQIVNTPTKTRTLGESAAETITPKHPPASKARFASEISVAEGKNIVANSVAKNMNFSASYDTEMDLPNNAAKEALRLVTGEEPDTNASLNNFLDALKGGTEYANPVGGEDPQGMDVEVWEAIKGIATGDFDSEAFDEQMTSNYGEDWVGRFASFAVKEVAIDGALLLLASTVAGAPIAAALKFAQVGLRANAIGIMGRTAVVALGGGAAQSAQNAALDRPLNFGNEVAFRALGNGVFEALALGGRVGIAKFKGRNTKEIADNFAKEAGIKALSKKDISKALDGRQFDVAPSAGLIRQTMFDSVEGYQKVMGDTADAILKENADEGMRKGLSAFLGVDEAALDSVPMNTIVDDLIGFRTRIDKAGQVALKNQQDNSRGLALHLMSKIRGEYDNASQLSQLYLDGDSLLMRSTDNNINSATNSVTNELANAGRVAEPSRVAARSGSNFLTAKDFSAKLGNGFRKMYEDAMGKPRLLIGRGATDKFTKEEVSTINHLLEVGDVDNMVYDFQTAFPRDVDASLVTPKIAEAYTKLRSVIDVGFELHDQSLVKALGGSIDNVKTGRVFKVGNDFVEITKIGLPNNKMEGRIFNRLDLNSTSGKVVNNISKGELKEIDTILPYRNGHLPRAYQNHRYSVVVMNSKGGTISREALFNNRFEAEEFLKKRNGLKGDGEAVTIMFNNVDTGLSGITAQRSSMNVINAVSEADKEVLIASLRAAGLDESNVRLYLKNLGTAKPSKSHAAGRTDLGSATTVGGKNLRLQFARAMRKVNTATTKEAVKKAEASAAAIKRKIEKNIPNEIQPTQESIVEYMGSIAHAAGHNNWRRSATEHFNSEYGKHLAEGGTWSNPLVKGDVDPGLKTEIKRFSRFLVRNISQRTFGEKAFDGAVVNVTDRLAKKAIGGSRAAKGLVKLFDHIPLANDIGNGLRWTAAFPKLLFYPFAQVYVQGSQLVPTVFAGAVKDPIGLGLAMAQWPRMVHIHALRQLNKKIPRSLMKTDSFKAYEDIIRAGYTADLTTADTLFGMKSVVNPTFGAKLRSSIKRGGAAPFRGGEAINRTTAFLVVRKQFMRGVEKYEKALASGVKGDDLKELIIKGMDGETMRAKDIGSQSFLEAVVDKAAVTALNMGKAGELEALSGAGSVVFQFKQVLFKQVAIFDSTKLSKLERLSAATGLLTFWGAAGVPLVADILNLADSAYYNLISGGSPNDLRNASDYARVSSEWLQDQGKELAGIDKEFTRRFLESGAIAAFTDGELNFSNRVALGRFWTDMVEVQDSLDMVVSFAVMADVKDAVMQLAGKDADILNLLNPLSMIEINAQMGKGLTFKEAIAKQFTPESTIGKFIAGDTTIGSASLEALREIGTVFSQAGTVSRVLDAAYRSVISPFTSDINDNATEKYMTSGLRGVDVERSSIRDTMLFLGVTPGKMVEEFSKKRLEFKYKEAMAEHDKKFKKDIRNSGGRDSAKNIQKKYIREIGLHRDNMIKLGLDIKVTQDALRTSSNTMYGIFLDQLSGGKVKK